VAEQLGWAIRQLQPDAVAADSLRNAVNSFFYRDPLTLPPSGPATQLTAEPHSFSRVFTAGFFEALAGMAAAIASPATDAALVTAGRDAGTLLVDAVRSAPVATAYFSQIATQMVAADKKRFAGKYAAALKSAFVRRGVLSLKDASRPKAGPLRTLRGKGAASAGITPRTLPASEFALGAGRLHVEAASASPPVSEAAARAFLSYLFRRGRVALSSFGAAATRVEHPDARKTHDLVRRDKGFAVVRRTFDCGFDFA
jgi:hypothetical protein